MRRASLIKDNVIELWFPGFIAFFFFTNFKTRAYDVCAYKCVRVSMCACGCTCVHVSVCMWVCM